MDEVINDFISIIDNICDKVRELLNGTKPNLEGYEPKRKLELFKELLKFSGGAEVPDDVVAKLLKDFESSKKTFSDWWLQQHP